MIATIGPAMNKPNQPLYPSSIDPASCQKKAFIAKLPNSTKIAVNRMVAGAVPKAPGLKKAANCPVASESGKTIGMITMAAAIAASNDHSIQVYLGKSFMGSWLAPDQFPR